MAVIAKQVGKHKDFVFSYRGKLLSQVNTRAWRNALARVGITKFRWHDLRHTWASWLVQQGVSIAELQELSGWESVQMGAAVCASCAGSFGEVSSKVGK